MTCFPQFSTFVSWLSLKSTAEKLFIAALATYIFFYLPALTAYRGAESAMILAFVWLAFVSGRKTGLRSLVIHDPLFLACTIMLGFLALARLWYSSSLPSDIEPGTRETRYFLKPIMVFLVALGMGVIARPYRWHLLLLSALGLATYFLTTIGTGYWTQAWAGKRTDFGIHNAQHTAMFCGAALIGLSCFTVRIVTNHSSRWHRVAIPLVVLTFAVLTFVFISAQTRAAWLGILIASILALAVAGSLVRKNRHRTHGQKSRKAIFFLTLLILFGAGLSGLNAPERIKTTFSNHDFALAPYITLQDHTTNPVSSHGVRLFSWRVALEWLKERPLMGWGPGSVDDLIDESEFFSDSFKKRFGHLHNSFIESLIANGLVGTAILLAMIVWLGIATFVAHRKGQMPNDVFIFAVSFFGFWITINLFESYALYTTGHYINAVTGGFIYSFCIQSHDEEASP
ncbi:O-antigen ligase family protein [Marinobacter sp. F3R11]|uniref:O-antigen ligase family protein n=1 Tax=Marinobacter sp. F3R11 TaxID=2267231 RepID=UPI000DEBF648|nr:O-antigen ligase family protein [Marinobacter sp. F3R11]RBW48119.1 hypothetical protein DS878_14755 [Marinobacter sp. F3R11]